MTKNLVFIDNRVADYQSLITSLSADSKWVLIDGNRDGILQMQSALTGYSNLDSIQIISHGSAGTLYLGSTVLDSDNLLGYQMQLRTIGLSLSETGDVLLYGCNVGAGQAGRDFVDLFSQITGADVAASDDLTGQNGDWLLEINSGAIEEKPIQASYAGTLLSWVGNAEANTGYGSADNDNLDGAGGNDTIYGFQGSDLISGGDGNDKILTGSGNDTVFGGEGDDDINGYVTTPGSYYFYSVSGAQLLNGEEGSDDLFGGEDSDTLNGGAGNDNLYGMAGSDLLDGGTGNDYLFGDTGNDTLDGGTGNNTLQGGAGDDQYLIRSFNDTIFDSEGSNDSASVYVDFYKTNTSIEHWQYAPGVSALPYWIDALLPGAASGYQSLRGENSVMYYCFPGSMPSGISTSDQNGWQAFSEAEKTIAREKLAYISTLINVTFLETTDTNQGKTICFANNQQINSGGYAYYPDEQSRSSLFIDIDGAQFLGNGDLLIHELGHSLGMKHSFGGINPIDGSIGETPALSAAEESKAWSVMSYSGTAPEIYQEFDIATLQYLYGVSTSSRTGDDRYVIDTGTTNIIWDGGGNDSIDGAALTGNLVLHLSPGNWDYVGSKATYISSAGQITVNIGSQIENAIAGSGNDSVWGNASNNAIFGNAGNDTLDGGAGIDTMVGGNGNDYYYVRDIGDVVSETNATATTGGSDTVYSYLASYSLGNNVENGRIMSIGTASLTGNTLNNVLYAGKGSNVITGGIGTDTASFYYGVTGTTGVTASLVTGLATGSGTDTLSGIERLYGSNNADKFTGDANANYLYSYAGNDTLDGGAGIDTMVGGDGNDCYYVRDIGDVVSETNATATTGGSDTVYSYLASYSLGNNVENGLIANIGTASLTGNTLNNVLYAGKGSNVITGGAGTDTVSFYYGVTGATGITASLVTGLATGSGTDTLSGIERLYGSNNADKFTGDANANYLSSYAGNDTLYGGLGNDMLTGGSESDWFVFDTALGATNIDTITDFTHGIDKLVLDDDIFKALGVVGTSNGATFNAAAFYALAGANAAHLSTDRIIYNTSSGQLYYDADGSATTAAVQIALIGTATHPSLSSVDFLVVA